MTPANARVPRALLRDLLITTKDGDWGKSEPSEGHVAFRVIRGTDFAKVRVGDVDSVPLRYLSTRTVGRRTIESNDILIETAGGTSDRPTGRSLLITNRVLEQLGGNVSCASFARFLRIDPAKACPAYVFWFLQDLYERGEMRQHEVRHTGVGRFQYTTFASTVEVPLPPAAVQRGIAATLGALDEKIESNRQASNLLRRLGQALVTATGWTHPTRLRDLASSITRGVTPQYADHDRDALIVINQKCIRNGRVNLAEARRMTERQVSSEKRVTSGDILVNSTGTGTLGRVGRWHVGQVYADSHVSIIKADPARIGPTLLAYLMFSREADIGEMGTGSTGQTELSPARLGDLILNVPRAKEAWALEPILLNLESRGAAFEAETATLTKLRDSLLPELLCGRIRVPEGREAVADA